MNRDATPLSFPWFRALLDCASLALAFYGLRYDRSAAALLQRGDELVMRQMYETASVAYQMVVEKHSLSSSVPAAKDGLRAILPALSVGPQSARINMTWLESLTPSLDPYVVDQFPLTAMALATALFAFVLVTRVGRRRGWATLAILLGIVCAGGFVALLGSYGAIDVAMGRLGLELVDFQMLYPMVTVALVLAMVMTLCPVRARNGRPTTPAEREPSRPRQQPARDRLSLAAQ